MKNLLPLLLFFSFAVQAQTTSQGTIYYSKYPNIFSGSSISKNNEVFAPESENAAFILYFNTDQSFYSYDVASNNKRESQRAMVAMSRGGYYQRNFSEELFYKNLAQQQYIRKTSLYGRYFIIEDKMSSLAWEIGTETKIIAGHLCIKAIIPDTTTFISTNTFIDVRWSDLGGHKSNLILCHEETRTSIKSCKCEPVAAQV
ncbi:MAG: GLPGLI family protein [Bacteroidetes Order II. Incertae sedis bacterium]|nr:GLPGLI family protein [Bacteroidetes Order II. bacterium]